jgi:hypothetical protein
VLDTKVVPTTSCHPRWTWRRLDGVTKPFRHKDLIESPHQLTRPVCVSPQEGKSTTPAPTTTEGPASTTGGPIPSDISAWGGPPSSGRPSSTSSAYFGQEDHFHGVAGEPWGWDRSRSRKEMLAELADDPSESGGEGEGEGEGGAEGEGATVEDEEGPRLRAILSEAAIRALPVCTVGGW